MSSFVLTCKQRSKVSNGGVTMQPLPQIKTKKTLSRLRAPDKYKNDLEHEGEGECKRQTPPDVTQRRLAPSDVHSTVPVKQKSIMSTREKEIRMPRRTNKLVDTFLLFISRHHAERNTNKGRVAIEIANAWAR